MIKKRSSWGSMLVEGCIPKLLWGIDRCEGNRAGRVWPGNGLLWFVAMRFQSEWLIWKTIAEETFFQSPSHGRVMEQNQCSA